MTTFLPLPPLDLLSLHLSLLSRYLRRSSGHTKHPVFWEFTAVTDTYQSRGPKSVRFWHFAKGHLSPTSWQACAAQEPSSTLPAAAMDRFLVCPGLHHTPRALFCDLILEDYQRMLRKLPIHVGS